MSNVDIGAVGNKDIGAVQSPAVFGGEFVNVPLLEYNYTLQTPTFYTRVDNTVITPKVDYTITLFEPDISVEILTIVNLLTAEYNYTLQTPTFSYIGDNAVQLPSLDYNLSFPIPTFQTGAFYRQLCLY